MVEIEEEYRANRPEPPDSPSEFVEDHAARLRIHAEARREAEIEVLGPALYELVKQERFARMQAVIEAFEGEPLPL